jgi:hypothetical protein
MVTGSDGRFHLDRVANGPHTVRVLHIGLRRLRTVRESQGLSAPDATDRRVRNPRPVCRRRELGVDPSSGAPRARGPVGVGGASLFDLVSAKGTAARPQYGLHLCGWTAGAGRARLLHAIESSARHESSSGCPLSGITVTIRTSLLLLLASAPLALAAQSSVPVAREPRHHAQLANDRVRVFDVTVPPGDTTRHPRGAGARQRSDAARAS